MYRLTNKTTLSLAIVLTTTVMSLSSMPQAEAAERSLGGIKIFSPIAIVLKRFGGPTFLTSGDVVADITYTSGRPSVTPPNGTGSSPSMATSDTGIVAGADTNTNTIDPLYDHGNRYYYDLPNKGIIYEFVSTSAGRVVEIKLIGYKSSVKTSLGIGLGSDYEQIVLKYGYPEATINENAADGDQLTLIYTQRSHIAFRLVRNRVAEISVVAPD